jgi:two-component system, response regulator RegA
VPHSGTMSNAPDIAIRTVWVVDEDLHAATSLQSEFRALGIAVELLSTSTSVGAQAAGSWPDLLVTELRVKGKWTFPLVTELKRQRPTSKVIVVTAYPSVATAVRAARAGVDDYVSKPVEATALLERLRACHQPRAAEGQPEAAWPTLARTTWEYLNQVLVSAGTVREAARQLGVDRRSLRRMLAKYPPAK